MTAHGMLAAARTDLGLSGRPNRITRSYARRNGAEYLRAPWCDMGVTEWARKSDNASAVLPRGDRAYTVWHAEDGQRLGRWHAGTVDNIRRFAEPGSLVFFDWDGTNDPDRIDHVGVIEEVLADGRVQTIEANTGDACKRRVRNAAVIAGFWTPDYEEDDMPTAREMWNHEIPVPWGTEDNPDWQADSLLVNTNQKAREIQSELRVMNATIQGQAETIRLMAETIAQGVPVDGAELVERIERALGAITIRLITAEENHTEVPGV